MVLTLLGLSGAQADETAIGCGFNVGYSRWYPTDCVVKDEGGTITVRWQGAGDKVYLTRLAIDRDGAKAEAVWSGFAGGEYTTEPLGILGKDGNCWFNETARLCFTRQGEGEAYADDSAADDPNYDGEISPDFGGSGEGSEIAQEIAGDEEEAERALANEAAGQGEAGATLANASSFRGLQLGMSPSQVVAALPQPMILAAERAGGDVLQELTGFAEQFTPGAGSRIKGFIVNNQSTCGEVTFVDARVDRLRLHQCFFNIPPGMTIEDFVQQVIDNYRIEDGMSGRWEMLGDGPYRFKYTEYVGVRREASERFTASLHEMNGVLTLTVERIPSVNFN